MSDVLYFGCWNRPGHYLVKPGGGAPDDATRRLFDYGRGLDGCLAPRRHKNTSALCWGLQDPTGHLDYQSTEYPQGHFLLHVLSNGYTAIQWWDRTQGDTRGACNSTLLLRGTHTTEQMVAALRWHFPHVVENLECAGIALVEVKP